MPFVIFSPPRISVKDRLGPRRAVQQAADAGEDNNVSVKSRLGAKSRVSKVR